LQIQDKYNDRKVWVAPDGYVAGSISFSANQYEVWYPPAGYKRGILNVLDTSRNLKMVNLIYFRILQLIRLKRLRTWHCYLGQRTYLQDQAH